VCKSELENVLHKSLSDDVNIKFPQYEMSLLLQWLKWVRKGLFIFGWTDDVVRFTIIHVAMDHLIIYCTCIRTLRSSERQRQIRSRLMGQGVIHPYCLSVSEQGITYFQKFRGLRDSKLAKYISLVVLHKLGVLHGRTENGITQ
jgi:hypothetical protein